MLRVYTTAPPADGQANKAVIALLAKKLRVPKSSISIVRGETSRDKVLAFRTLSREEVEEKLLKIE